jgi:hypothetical protein
MIDLETMGTSCISAIMSIGAVSFTLSSGKINELYHTGVDLKSCASANMDINADTILWWLKQSKENQERLLSLKTKSLKDSLIGLFDSFNGLNKYTTCVWSHGSNFDTVIIENACKLVGVPVWWEYKNIRDTRTVFDVFGYKYIAKGEHDALRDAKNQAEAIIHVLNGVMEG